MSFQAYLDTIKAKTGKTPEDFKALAKKKGLLGPGAKAGEVTAWLKQEFGLGHGHAMAIYTLLKAEGQPRQGSDEKVAAHFKGDKASWRKAYDTLIARVAKFGPDVTVAPTSSYISLLRDNKKFGIVQISAADRIDLGLKLKGVAPAGRLETAGKWNAMVTHRVRIHDPKQLDKEVLTWLKRAFEAA